MITQESVEKAAKSRPGRYTLYYDKDKLVAYDDADTGYHWFKLPDGVWAWVS